MKDKEKIKEELERRISNLEQLGDRKYIERYFEEQFRFIEVYEGLIKFIDSLPEEPVSEDRINECLNWDKDLGCSTSPMNNCDSCPQAKWVEVKEEKENYNERYKRIAQTEQFKKSYCDKSLGKEEPANENLEEEIEKIWTNCATTWVPSASGESSLLEEIGHYELNLSKSDFKGIAHHFAEWQRKKDVEKMMKTLVNGEIVKDIHNQVKVTSGPLNDTFGKFGDRVKIIIVNND